METSGTRSQHLPTKQPTNNSSLHVNYWWWWQRASKWDLTANIGLLLAYAWEKHMLGINCWHNCINATPECKALNTPWYISGKRWGMKGAKSRHSEKGEDEDVFAERMTGQAIKGDMFVLLPPHKERYFRNFINILIAVAVFSDKDYPKVAYIH